LCFISNIPSLAFCGRFQVVRSGIGLVPGFRLRSRFGEAAAERIGIARARGSVTLVENACSLGADNEGDEGPVKCTPSAEWALQLNPIANFLKINGDGEI